MTAPELSVFSGGFDRSHALLILSFVDPDRHERRQITINAVDLADGFSVDVAGSQTHLPDAERYLDEARRIAATVFQAAFPRKAPEQANS